MGRADWAMNCTSLFGAKADFCARACVCARARKLSAKQPRVIALAQPLNSFKTHLRQSVTSCSVGWLFYAALGFPNGHQQGPS